MSAVPPKNFGSFEGGSFVKQDDDLPLHVHALVIVPVELGRGDAVADEDRLGVELFEFLLRLARAGEALLAGDVERGFALHRLERRFRAGDDAHERDGLEVGAAFADRLEAGLLELVRDDTPWRGTRRGCRGRALPAGRSPGRRRRP